MQKISFCCLDSFRESSLPDATVVQNRTGLLNLPPRTSGPPPIPAGIATPDQVESRLGTLKFFDGFPDEATVEKMYDNLDFQRGVQSFLRSLPAASLYGLRRGLRTIGPDNQTVIFTESLTDTQKAVAESKARFRVYFPAEAANPIGIIVLIIKVKEGSPARSFVFLSFAIFFGYRELH